MAAKLSSTKIQGLRHMAAGATWAIAQNTFHALCVQGYIENFNNGTGYGINVRLTAKGEQALAAAGAR